MSSLFNSTTAKNGMNQCFKDTHSKYLEVVWTGSKDAWSDLLNKFNHFMGMAVNSSDCEKLRLKITFEQCYLDDPNGVTIGPFFFIKQQSGFNKTVVDQMKEIVDDQCSSKSKTSLWVSIGILGGFALLGIIVYAFYRLKYKKTPTGEGQPLLPASKQAINNNLG